LDLRGLGGQELHVVLAQPKRAALLCYLALASPRGFHRRDTLLALFWPEHDTERARNALSQAVHFLRRSLGTGAIVSRNGDALSLDRGAVWCDAVAFEEALDSGRTAEALDLYRGDLLTAFHVSDAPEFERWADLERERLRRRAANAALDLAREEEARGGTLRAPRWLRRALEISPYDEGTLRRLLRRLDEAGDRAEAIQEYDAFARRLRSDLELEPAPETAALADAIRGRVEPRGGASQEIPLGLAPRGESLREGHERVAAAESPRELLAAGTEGVAAARAPLRATRSGRRLALGGLLVILAGGLVVARPRTPPSLDPNLLAVAPFEVLDPKLELWREGLVDVLARTLDGFGPFRTVSPSVVMRRWQGRADRESASTLAYRAGAAFVVFGQLLGAGPDSVRLTGAVLDSRSGRALVEIDRTDEATRIDRLADSVSLDVIRTLMPTTSGTHVRLYSVGTRSLPALKAFLQGEHFLRRFALDSAIAGYERAVAIDTTFALALRRLQLALGWNSSGRTVDYFARAAALNRGLSPRDSLLVLSDSTPPGSSTVQVAGGCCSIVLRKFAVLQEAARRYPEDPEVWYQLGEMRFHVGDYVGASWNDARAAFDRAIALDSGFAPAYIHPVEIALSDNDPQMALRYVRGYLGISSVIPGGAAIHHVGELLDPRGTGPRALGRELDTASFHTLHLLALAVRLWPDVNETQVKVWPRLVAAGRARLAAGDSGVYLWLRALESIFPSVLIHRGHLQEARRVVGSRFGGSFMELARLGAVAPDTVEQALEAWFRHPSREDVSIYGRLTATPCSRTMDAALWWASRKDTTKLRQLVDRESGVEAGTGPTAGDVNAWRVPGFVRAALALAQGDTALALRRFLAFPDSVCRGAWQVREARFRVLAASGRGAEAAAVFDRSNDRWVPLVLERARLADRLGDRPGAIKWYQFVADAWRHADPELQPVVAEARAAIARLRGQTGH
jgi:serine/threonine-protein kinase